MTNPGIPPVLSKLHHDEVTERVETLKAELDTFLDTIDEILDGGEPASETPDAA